MFKVVQNDPWLSSSSDDRTSDGGDVPQPLSLSRMSVKADQPNCCTEHPVTLHGYRLLNKPGR